MDFPGKPRAGPPDLLKRFVPTPFRADLRIGSTRVLVKTNDPAIPHALRDRETPSRIRPLRLFRWKLVRDGDVREARGEPILVRSGPLVVVSMGPACLIGVDYEKNELFAFLGAAASGGEFAASVLPVLRELTEKAPGGRAHKRKAPSRPVQREA